MEKITAGKHGRRQPNIYDVIKKSAKIPKPEQKAIGY
jgi:hypothetical protein